MADAAIVLDQSNPVPIKIRDNADGTFSLAVGGPRGALVDHSGTAPDVAEHQIAPANTLRNYLLIQNNSTNSSDIWVNLGSGANIGEPSIKLSPGDTLVWELGFIPTGAVHVIAASAGGSYTCKEG